MVVVSPFIILDMLFAAQQLMGSKHAVDLVLRFGGTSVGREILYIVHGVCRQSGQPLNPSVPLAMVQYICLFMVALHASCPFGSIVVFSFNWSLLRLVLVVGEFLKWKAIDVSREIQRNPAGNPAIQKRT